MSYMEAILREFDEALADFNDSRPMKRLAARDIDLDHYKSLLRQIFHHARENPQIQALATVYFRGPQRDVIKHFYRHAASEIGHDQLALNDLASLGEDVSAIPAEDPLPATTALIGFPFYQIQNLDPVGYLGYLFFLEFTPTRAGGRYIETLEAVGVPPEALSFLEEHRTADQGHNKLMERYVEKLVSDDDGLRSVIYAMKVTGKLYARMVEEAFDQADHPKDWGRSTEEKVLSAFVSESR